jgi:hypothetical protein
MCISGLIEGFGQNISKLRVGINMAQIDVPFLMMISEKMKVNINVLGFECIIGFWQHLWHSRYHKVMAHDENSSQNLAKWPSSKATTSNS